MMPNNPDVPVKLQTSFCIDRWQLCLLAKIFVVVHPCHKYCLCPNEYVFLLAVGADPLGTVSVSCCALGLQQEEEKQARSCIV